MNDELVFLQSIHKLPESQKKDNKTVQKPWNDMILQMHVDKYVFSKRIMCTITKVGYKFGYYFSQWAKKYIMA